MHRHLIRISESGPTRVRRLGTFGDEQTVGAIAAAVDDAGDVLIHVVEEKEVVAQQLHLLDRFLDVHRLDHEAFGTDEIADILLVVQFNLVGGRGRLGLSDATAYRLLTWGMAAERLSWTRRIWRSSLSKA